MCATDVVADVTSRPHHERQTDQNLSDFLRSH